MSSIEQFHAWFTNEVVQHQLAVGTIPFNSSYSVLHRHISESTQPSGITQGLQAPEEEGASHELGPAPSSQRGLVAFGWVTPGPSRSYYSHVRAAVSLMTRAWLGARATAREEKCVYMSMCVDSLACHPCQGECCTLSKKLIIMESCRHAPTSCVPKYVYQPWSKAASPKSARIEVFCVCRQTNHWLCESG